MLQCGILLSTMRSIEMAMSSHLPHCETHVALHENNCVPLDSGAQTQFSSTTGRPARASAGSSRCQASASRRNREDILSANCESRAGKDVIETQATDAASRSAHACLAAAPARFGDDPLHVIDLHEAPL